MKTVISLFDYTCVMGKPWIDAGYTVYCVDIQHQNETIGNLHKVHANLMEPWRCPVGREQIAFVSAFPPCDHLAVSGARWFKGKGLRILADSINMFATAAEFCELSGAPYMIENPVSTISTYWRKPDYIFHPHHYTGFESSDNYTKKTCLWTGNGFIMPVHFVDETLCEPDNRIHHAAPSPERKAFRSATPGGFAQAVYEANR